MNRMRRWLTGLLTGLLLPLAAAAQIQPDDLLPVDEAFALSADLRRGEVILDWQIAEGYYLYRHALSVDPGPGARLGPPDIPAGERTVDDFFGETETYRHHLRVVVPVERMPSGGRLELTAGFQGCADLGVCYPPHRQLLTLTAPDRSGGASPVFGTSRSSGDLGQLLGGSQSALPAEQAFRYEAIADGPGGILVRMSVQPGYYLYRHSFVFSVPEDGIEVLRAELPPGEAMHDEYFGDTEVYFGQVEIPLSLSRPAGDERNVRLVAEFQGCKDEGICYPPMTRSLDVALPAASAPVDADLQPAVAEPPGQAAPVAAAARGEQDRLARFIEEQPLALTLLLFVLLGIGLAFTPCVFPMVPILSGIIAGEGEDITRAKAFALSLTYVLAMALTYTAVGVFAALAGYNLQAAFQNPWVLGVFAAIFVALSLAMFGFYNLQMPPAVQARLSEISNSQSGGSLTGAGIMGFLSALIVGPCVTAPLIGILIFISQTGDAVLGGSVLFALSIGMGLPLLAIGVGLGHWLPKAGAWMNAIKSVFGVGLLALAIWMLERIIAPQLVMVLWGILAVASGVYLGALTRLDASAPGWQRLWQSLGVVLLVFGVLQLVGAASGGRDWMRPLGHLVTGEAGSPMPQAAEFRRVDTVAELKAAVAAADRPVLLDFYADWCVDCVRMERRTFSDPAVAARLDNFVLLKADVTAYDAEDKAMLEQFGLIGPPAYLFFDRGRELAQYRMFGFMSPARFAALLDEVAR